MNIQAILPAPPYPPGQQPTTVGPVNRTVTNTVVAGNDGVITYDPGSNDSALNHPTIPWNTVHMNPVNQYFTWTYWAHVSIVSLSGTVIKTITKQTQAGPNGADDSVQWDGSLDQGMYPASKGVYLYKVRVDHAQTGGGSDMCGRQDKVEGIVTAVSIPVFEMHADLDKIKIKVTYTLGVAAGSCWLKVYGPGLQCCMTDTGLAATAGQHTTGEYWVDAVSGAPPNYYAVVGGAQTTADALNNRDRGTPHPALQQGAMATYLVKAVNWCDPTLVTGLSGAIGNMQAQAGYAPTNHDIGCPDLNSALGTNGGVGFSNAAVWTVFGHGHDPYFSPDVNLPGTVPGGHIFGYPNPQPGDPPGYDSSRDLNVRDYAGSWNQLLFVLYITCHSGEVTDGRDLLADTVSAGAKAALGFKEDIYGDPAGAIWSYTFWDQTCGDTPVGILVAAEAAKQAVIDQLGQAWLFDQERCAGNASLVLKPAQYGW
jgi:hypothetical protein